MNELLIGLTSVLAAAAPVVVAVVGETFTERSGVINLSVNGIILLSAMVGFAAAQSTESSLAGIIAGMAVGMAAGAFLAFSSITLKAPQVAVGFIMTLLLRDLSYFLGTPLMGLSASVVGVSRLPLLADIPVVGGLLFNQSILTYVSYFVVIFAYLWIFHTRHGLVLRAVGEQPHSSYARGIKVNRLRYLCLLYTSPSPRDRG